MADETKRRIHRGLIANAPDQAAALLLHEAAQLVHDAGRIMSMAGFHSQDQADDGDKDAAARMFALRDECQRHESDLDRIIERLLNRSIDLRLADLRERFYDYDKDYAEFRPGMLALVEFLTGELSEGWTLHSFTPEGAEEIEGGKVSARGWAFQVAPGDTCSYVKRDHGGNWCIEWLGTTWEPGCECADSDQGPVLDGHLPECPAAS